VAVVSASIVASCSSGEKTFDARSTDAAVDAGIDAGRCAPGFFVTGEYIDWDSSDVTFRGIFDASFTVQSDPTKTDKTSPNGRFELCAPNASRAVLTVDGPGAGTTAYVDGLMVIDKAVIDASAAISARSFTAARAVTFFQEQAVPTGFDANRSQLLVNVVGTPRAVTVDAAATALSLNGATWGAGATGSTVFFANLPAGRTTVNVGSSGTVIGAGAVPLTAGKFTYVTLMLQ
jgi:hypothetical protein